MTGRTHDLAAITVLGVVVLSQPAAAYSLSTLIIAVFANLAGGIALDVDQPTAPFWRNLPIGGVIGRVMTRLLGGHRFLSHSLLGAALFGYGAWLLLGWLGPIMPHVDRQFVWSAFMLGFVSHLVMDSLTEEGVPWLLPVPVKFGFPPVKAWRIKTDHAAERWLVFPALLAFDAWYLYAAYPQLLAVLHRLRG